MVGQPLRLRTRSQRVQLAGRPAPGDNIPKAMSYLVNLSVAGQPAIVIGGGDIAARKVNDLLESGARVTVVSPVIAQPIQDLAAAQKVRVHLRPYESGDLRGALIVIAATDDEALNAEISRDARSLGVLVNVVDRPALCTFILPAVVRRGDLTIAISTEGQCPALASVIREELAAQFGEEYADLVSAMGALRRKLISQGWDGQRIRQAIRDLYREGIVNLIATNDGSALAALYHKVLGDGAEGPAA